MCLFWICLILPIIYYMNCELDLKRFDSRRWEIVLEEIGTLAELEGLCALTSLPSLEIPLTVSFMPSLTLPSSLCHIIKSSDISMEKLREHYLDRIFFFIFWTQCLWINSLKYRLHRPGSFPPWLHQKFFYEGHSMKSLSCLIQMRDLSLYLTWLWITSETVNHFYFLVILLFLPFKGFTLVWFFTSPTAPPQSPFSVASPYLRMLREPRTWDSIYLFFIYAYSFCKLT